MLRRFVERQNAYQVIGQYVTADGRRQTTALSWLGELISAGWSAERVLDLGCGDGRSADVLKRLLPGARWYGVDIESSPEVERRTRTDVRFDTFNGTDLPYEDESFDLIYSFQVLEHVRYPDRLMIDVTRVLKKDGLFIGEVSYLEPYHSYSVFNFTPYGLSRVVADAGLELCELRPGIDAYSLITRQLFGGSKALGFLFKRSPMNLMIGLVGTVAMLPSPMIGFLKLQYAGQFCFLATRKAS